MTNSLPSTAAALATPHRREASTPLRHLSLAVLLLGGAAAARAGQVTVGVTASAIDNPDGYASVTQSDSSNPLGTLVASSTAGVMAGSSFSQADASVDGYVGAIHMGFSAATANPITGPLPGRSAAAGGGASITGSIKLSDGLAPGDATFTAVLEGLYNGGPADTGFGNAIVGTYDYSVSTDNVNGKTLTDSIYATGGQAGTIFIPLSITLPVHGGEFVYFDLELLGMGAKSLSGTVGLDLSNTFKITGIDLPPGYTYTPDSDGFLSQFAATPVPEPATGSMALAGLLGVVMAAARRRPLKRASSHDAAG